MTFTQIMKDIASSFSRKPKSAKDNSADKGAKRFLSKISGAFMLPVSIMAVAGLFLGIGAAFEAHTSAKVFGSFIKNMGDPIFGAMPLLFMVAIVISFTDDIGTAVFTGIIAFLVFNAMQIPFIEANGNSNVGTVKFLGINTSEAIQEKMYKIVGANLGITSLNTSIFGGIVVGFFVSYIYKKFYMIELPTAMAFFGGKRFPPLVSIISMIPLTFIFLLIWPWIGVGLAYFGEYSGKVSGLDSFIFGYVERSLIPFGLHHVFYAPLWWTSAGGDVTDTLRDTNITSINGGEITSASVALDDIKAIVKVVNTNADGHLNLLGEHLGKLSHFTWAPPANGAADGVLTLKLTGAATSDIMTSINTAITNTVSDASKADNADAVKATAALIGKYEWQNTLTDVVVTKIKSFGTYLGDSFGWQATNSSGIYKVNNTPIFKFIADHGLRLGRFMQGKFAFMQLGLPAAGAAMIMAAPKENRKMAASVIFPASLTSFVTGVTEPIEFTFLFLAPWMFWGFHATMAAFSFLFMNLLGAHVGMTFSGGIIDTIIYGAIPFSAGTNFYWMYVIGIVYAPIYYFFFYWAIKKFNLETPGRGNNTQLFTKKDYQAKKDGANAASLSPQAAQIVKAAGGWSNITKFDNCASRLRWDVKDISKVDEKALKKAGANGVLKVGKNHIQIIIGTKADSMNSQIKANKGAKL